MPISRTGFNVAPVTLNFGNVQELTTPPPMSIVVTNISTSGPVSFYITPDDARFTSPQAGNHTLASPGNTLTVQFFFNASAVLGTATCDYINFLGVTPPTNVFTVTANVVTSVIPAWNASPGAVNFGTLKIGTSSSPRNVTVTNTGAVNVTINSIVLSPTDFSLSGLPTLPTTLVPGGFFIFQVTANSEFRGVNDYNPGITLTPSSGPPVIVELIYTGFALTPAFTLTGNTQGVLFGLAGFWDGAFLSTIAQSLVSLPCEQVCLWQKQIDFDNPGANTYLNKVFVRTEPAGPLTATMIDTTVISKTQTVVNSTFTVDPTLDANGLVKWMQFDFENNGESHSLVMSVGVNAGIMIMDLYLLQYEIRGPVYEGT